MNKFLVMWGVLFLAAGASAEVVYLKDGSKLTGTLTSGDDKGVVITTPDGVLNISRERIERIDYAGTASAPAGSSAPAASEAPGYDVNRVRKNQVMIGIGGAYPTGANDFDEVAGPGGKFSFEYFRELDRVFDVGFGIHGYGFGDVTKNTAALKGDYETGAASYMLMMRAHAYRESFLSPYAGIGVGVGTFSEKLEATPNAGFTWADTGSRETRKILDESSAGFAMQPVLGVQANFTPRFIGSLQTDYNFITIDKDKFGASSIQFFTFHIGLGWRY